MAYFLPSFRFIFKKSNHKIKCQSSDQITVRSAETCESRHEKKKKKNTKNECMPSKDSDQPGHPSNLIRVFAVRSMGS